MATTVAIPTTPISRERAPTSSPPNTLHGTMRPWSTTRSSSGTATLAIMLKRAHPAAVTNLDADPTVLQLTSMKVDAADFQIGRHERTTLDPPLAFLRFYRVVSSLVFHRLSSDNFRRTLRRAHELLRSAGALHIADWRDAQDTRFRCSMGSRPPGTTSAADCYRCFAM